MELKLKIYNGNTVEKEYTAETIDFSFGVVEDILDALDLDNMKTGSKTELAGIIIKCSKQLKPFLKDIFPGVTDEEIRRTHIQNLIEVFKGLYNYATTELGAATAGTEKN